MKARLFLLSFVLCLLSPLALSVEHFELDWYNSPSAQQSKYQSSQYQDAVWVVEAFFLGCPYCNDNAPNVNALQNYFKNDERVQILDLGIDKNDSAYAEWVRRHRPNHPVLKDPGRKLIRQLGTSSYPTTYILNKRLQVIYKHTGVWNSKVEAKIKDLVEEALLQR